MIRARGKEVTAIRAMGRVIAAVYAGGRLVWQAVRSCFGAGYWQGDRPWNGNDPWRGMP